MANLYLISQNVNERYDTYDSAVFVANTDDEAKRIHPAELTGVWGKETIWDDLSGTWAESSADVKVELIGEAHSRLEVGSVVIASFHAG